jgi:dihydroorotase
MSKFLYLGMSLSQVIKLSTHNPAKVIQMENELGTLKEGAYADLTLLVLKEGPIQLTDAGWDVPVETVTADRYLKPIGVVKAGQLILFNASN